jgi:molybdopterin synthase catalytic subunit
MRIHIKLFAILRERAGVAALALDLPPGDTVADAARAVAERCPAVAPYLPRVAFAVNQSYARPDVVLHDGDELALIPPVSGG